MVYVKMVNSFARDLRNVIIHSNISWFLTG